MRKFAWNKSGKTRYGIKTKLKESKARYSRATPHKKEVTWNDWKSGKYRSEKKWKAYSINWRKVKGTAGWMAPNQTSSRKDRWDTWKQSRGNWGEQGETNSYKRKSWSTWGSYSNWGGAKPAYTRSNVSTSKRSWAESEKGGEWRRVQQREEAENEASPSQRTKERSSGESRKRQRDDDAPQQDRRAKRIKVTNVPRDLSERDIEEAFEQETGTVLKCILKDKTAYITFAKSEDARKAVANFDRGQLNGRTISATLDP